MATWGVRLGRGGQFADAARAGNFLAIGWEELGDLSWLAEASDERAARERLNKTYEATFGQTGIKAGLAEGQIWRFVREIRPGDTVFAPHTVKGIVYVGIVRGTYRYVETPTDGCHYKSRRAIEWSRDLQRKELPGKLINSLGSLTTVFSLANRAAEIRAVLGGDGVAQPAPPSIDVVHHALGRLHAMHPKDFEAFVASYFRTVGYDAEPTQYVGDGGIDVVGTLDAEGLARVLLRVQVKRTKTNVGIETVLKTRGALAVDEQGAIITLGDFTDKARAEAEADNKKTIVLVDGETFVELLLDRWAELDESAQKLLGLRPKEAIPLRDRFTLADA
jgi:restriction system protein